MKKILLLIFGVSVSLLLVGCSGDGYNNSNDLEEEENFVIPEGIHSIELFVEQMVNNHTMKINNNGNQRNVYFDGNIRKETILGVDYIEVLEDSRYSFYDLDLNEYSVYLESQLDLDFILSDIVINDFTYDANSDSYAMNDDVLSELNLVSLVITYETEEFIFNVQNDISSYVITFESGIELVEPTSANLNLFNLDKVEELFDGGYTSYQVQSKFEYDYEVHFMYHAESYTRHRFGYYDTCSYQAYVEYIDGEATLLYVDKFFNGDYFATVIRSAAYWNEFVCDEVPSTLSIIEKSIYDIDNNCYIYSTENHTETYTFNADYTGFRLIDTRCPLNSYHDFSRYGEVSESEIPNLDLYKTNYVNLI